MWPGGSSRTEGTYNNHLIQLSDHFRAAQKLKKPAWASCALSVLSVSLRATAFSAMWPPGRYLQQRFQLRSWQCRNVQNERLPGKGHCLANEDSFIARGIKTYDKTHSSLVLLVLSFSTFSFMKNYIKNGSWVLEPIFDDWPKCGRQWLTKGNQDCVTECSFLQASGQPVILAQMSSDFTFQWNG